MAQVILLLATASVNIASGYVSGTGGQLTAEDIGEMNLIMQGDLA
jgi:hypothetical protein